MTAQDPTIERLAAVLCAKPVSTADSMRLYQLYLDESEREQWRSEARDVVAALIELGWTPPASDDTATCETCGCLLAFPTAPHILDCPATRTPALAGEEIPDRMTIDRHSARLRELVEGAGFSLVPLQGTVGDSFKRLRIDSARGRQVAFVTVTVRGFDAAFPDSQRRSSTPTELVDDLEDWTAGHQKGKW